MIFEEYETKKAFKLICIIKTRLEDDIQKLSNFYGLRQQKPHKLGRNKRHLTKLLVRNSGPILSNKMYYIEIKC